MKISDAARYFDNSLVTNSADGWLFKAQVDIYDKSTAEGIAAFRRTISVAPGVATVPTDKLFKIDSELFIVGRKVTDQFQGAPIRDSFVLQSTNAISEVHNPLPHSPPDQSCLGEKPRRKMSAQRSYLIYMISTCQRIPQ
jgi:hypothetical protein